MKREMNRWSVREVKGQVSWFQGRAMGIVTRILTFSLKKTVWREL